MATLDYVIYRISVIGSLLRYVIEAYFHLNARSRVKKPDLNEPLAASAHLP